MWLILDCNYLVHRAKHVFGALEYNGSATGAIYGFLLDLLLLNQRFSTQRMVFCWDGDYNNRTVLYPIYKMNRASKDLTKDELIFELAFREQVKRLRQEYLQTIGFKNVFREQGFESDDLIASVCTDLSSKVSAVIVSADRDLYQCLRPNVSMYDPRSKKLVTARGFRKRYNIRPQDWAKVKAIAGCSSDNVKGVVGVGEVTALKFIRHELNKDSKAYKDIKAHWKDVVLRNRKLVQLPFKDTPTFTLEHDTITQEGWNKVTKALGMRSIRYRRFGYG